MANSPIIMPKLGLTMTEGLLAEWSVAPGDEVRAGDVLFIVETDKISTEVEARGDGRIIELLVKPGETVEVGATLATWTGVAQHSLSDEPGGPGGKANEQSQHQSATQQVAIVESAKVAPGQAGSSDDRIVATPLARRLARDKGISLTAVSGTGPRGRIRSQDVLRALTEGDRPSVPTAPEALAQAPDPGARSIARRPATGFEKTVAKRLSEAKQQIPHFYVVADADMTDILGARVALNASGSAAKVSVNHLILLAVGRALQRHTYMSTIWDDGEIVTLGGTDVGFAVDTPRGLFAPVLRDVGQMRLDDLTAAAEAAARRAKDGALERGDLEGGAITVSNVGMFGASQLIPIINPGQAAIIGVGASKPQFLPDDAGAPQLRQITTLSLSGDHRVLDGVKCAKFLNDVVKLLEHPLDLLR